MLDRVTHRKDMREELITITRMLMGLARRDGRPAATGSPRRSPPTGRIPGPGTDPAVSAQTSDILLDRMMALHPKLIDLTLDRMWRILAALDHPERRLPPVIHIAGTNGKGSTLAMIRAGLEGAGLRVHAYTSPHLVRFHERIRLAGESDRRRSRCRTSSTAALPPMAPTRSPISRSRPPPPSSPSPKPLPT
jgi:hypothetical protein